MTSYAQSLKGQQIRIIKIAHRVISAVFDNKISDLSYLKEFNLNQFSNN